MNMYLVAILAILVVHYLLSTFVEILNVRNCSLELPAEFENWYDSEKYRKSQEYLKENTRFDIINSSIITPLLIIFILSGGFNMADRFAGSFHLGPIGTGLIFSGLLMLMYQIVHIPFSIYGTFIIEEKYGFNRTTPKTFIFDIMKTWIIAAIIGGAALVVVLWFFENSGPWAWIYCWIAVTTIQIFLAFISPVVILPLFNKFNPLDEGPLKESIESYARSQRFKIRGVYTMDGSKRSTKSNAFFTGLGRFRRIVLFDTLIKNHTPDELLSVLAHEMGHYKKKHILKYVLISIITTGLMFFVLSWFLNNRELFDAFQMEKVSIYASLVFFGFLYSPIETLLSIFTNMLSRKNEYEADAFSVITYKNPEAMISALKKLSIENLTNLSPHPVKVFMNYSHPPVLERIRAIRKISE